MNVLSAILLTFGLMGTILAFATAIGLRSDPKALKISLLCTIICITLTIIGVAIMPKSPSSSSSKNSATCQVCHTTYSYDDADYGGYSYENVRNIKKTNMCNRCYSNYKAASYAADKSKYYK